MWKKLGIAVLIIGLTGCQPILSRFNYQIKTGEVEKVDKNGSKSHAVDYLVMDAKQRVVSYIDTEDRVDPRTHRVIPKKLVCGTQPGCCQRLPVCD